MKQGIWVAPASNKNSKMHMRLTVLNDFEGSRFWGFEEKHQDKFNKLNVGDYLVFYQNKKITFKTKIKNKFFSKEQSFKCWPASKEEQYWPLIVELEHPQQISLPIEDVCASLKYKNNHIFRGNTYYDYENWKAPTLINMISETYSEVFVEKIKALNSSDFIEIKMTQNNEKKNKKKTFDVDVILNQKRKMNVQQTFSAQQRNGKKAEEIVVELLKQQYDKVRLMREDNNTSPFDIYCEKNGTKTFVEVKGTSSPSINTDFYMSNNEVQFAEYCLDNDIDYKLIRVWNLNDNPHWFELDIEKILEPNNHFLSTNVYRVDMSGFSKK